MASAPGSSPPTSPLTPSSPEATQDYARIVRSLQRRSADRLAGDHDPRTKSATPVAQDLEADLRLAAELGTALLRDKSTLQARVEGLEKGNQKLLDKLSGSVKENAQLQRRLEETVGSLEQADSSNRALLVSLEEDRKRVARLSVDSGKLAVASAKLKDLQRTHDDTLQELAAERKRANAAEAKTNKLGERAAELEVRLKKALEDLEELRQDKVLRTRRSIDALARLRTRSARDGALSSPVSPTLGTEGVSENTEAKELLKMVESLVTENNMLRSESMELHGLLEASRDEQVDLRTAMAEQDVFPGDDDQNTPTFSHDRRHSVASTSSAPYPPPSDSVISPSISQALTDYDFTRHPVSPSVTNATSLNRSWGASAGLSHSQRAVDLSRTFSGGSFSSDEHAALARSESRTRPPPITSVSTGVLNGGRIPVGRAHPRRAMSMDVTSQVRANQANSAPNSPRIEPSPSTRPASIFSNASEDAESYARPRRHHRPLSLSLGPSVFPQVPEDEPESRPISPFTRQPSHRRRPSQAPSLSSVPDGLGISGVSRRPRPSYSPERPTVTVDSSTQTTPPATPHSRASSPRAGPAPSQTSISDFSDDRLADLSASPGGSGSGLGGSSSPHQLVYEQRTAALAQLIEHVAKLLARVQAADIASQEKRLKKQNLPGDVRHVAQANLRDLATDIDGVRNHFRRVVELERAAHAKEVQRGQYDHSRATNANESLVSRRDFVSLVKLLRDLLYEMTRLRSLVNRVHLDPALAAKMEELDVPSALEPGEALNKGGAATTAGGLLAPLSRLFGASLSPEDSTLSRQASSAQLRPPPAKRGGSSTVSTATINVEFGSGTVRQASATPSSSSSAVSSNLQPSAALRTSTASAQSHPRGPDRQVRREISSIFAGAASRPSSSSTSGATVASAAPAGRIASAASAASSYIPFGRLLGSYRPALSSTTNAVLDSLPAAPPARHSSSALDDEDEDDHHPPPTLLERQLRPRGLSDSSIRSTYLSHAATVNPHHRLLSPASLALSSEPTRADDAAAAMLGTSPAAGALDALRTQLSVDDGPGGGKSISRRPSTAALRPKPSSSRLRDSSSGATEAIPVPAPPAIPPLADALTVVLSTSTATSDSSLVLSSTAPSASASAPIGISESAGTGAGTGGAAGLFGTMVSSAFGSLGAPVAIAASGGKGGVGRDRDVAESWKESGRVGRSG
ncbi:hypothetical protein JCM10207_006273 [Rhodosporidiobolus poonsookiae]